MFNQNPRAHSTMQLYGYRNWHSHMYPTMRARSKHREEYPADIDFKQQQQQQQQQHLLKDFLPKTDSHQQQRQQQHLLKDLMCWSRNEPFHHKYSLQLLHIYCSYCSYLFISQLWYLHRSNWITSQQLDTHSNFYIYNAAIIFTTQLLCTHIQVLMNYARNSLWDY